MDSVTDAPTLTASQIVAHAAGELDICPACGATGEFEQHPIELGLILRCPGCGVEQLDLPSADQA